MNRRCIVPLGRNSQSGMSLVSLLVAISLGGVLISILTTATAQGARFSAVLNLKDEVRQLRQWARVRLDCQRTRRLRNNLSRDGQLIQLALRPEGLQELWAEGGATGLWGENLQVRCRDLKSRDATEAEINCRYRLRPGGQSQGLKGRFAKWRPLFNVPVFCRSH